MVSRKNGSSFCENFCKNREHAGTLKNGDFRREKIGSPKTAPGKKEHRNAIQMARVGSVMVFVQFCIDFYRLNHEYFKIRGKLDR